MTEHLLEFLKNGNHSRSVGSTGSLKTEQLNNNIS